MTLGRGDIEVASTTLPRWRKRLRRTRWQKITIKSANLDLALWPWSRHWWLNKAKSSSKSDFLSFLLYLTYFNYSNSSHTNFAMCTHIHVCTHKLCTQTYACRHMDAHTHTRINRIIIMKIANSNITTPQHTHTQTYMDTPVFYTHTDTICKHPFLLLHCYAFLFTYCICVRIKYRCIH